MERLLEIAGEERIINEILEWATNVFVVLRGYLLVVPFLASVGVGRSGDGGHG